MLARCTIHDEAEDRLVGACMAVMAAAFDPAFGEAWTRPQLRSMIDGAHAVLVTARINDIVVGFGLVQIVLDDAELLLLAVHPDRRRGGHGRRLLLTCIEECARRGATTLYLEVRAGNPATALYHQTGFTQYSCRTNYYHGQDGTKFDALSYRLAL
jgi:ribosomal-protein-alanine N-acetyltransferase